MERHTLRSRPGEEEQRLADGEVVPDAVELGADAERREELVALPLHVVATDAGSTLGRKHE